MLRPPNLAVADYQVALKPALGYESKLFLSAKPSLELLSYDLQAANSGLATVNPPDITALASDPKEVIAVIQTDINDAGANVVLTLNGTDQNDAAATWVFTFQPPAYSPVTDKVFPVGFAVEGIPSGGDGKKIKTITNQSVVCNVLAKNLKITVFGVPSIADYSLVGCKTQLNYDLKTPEPISIQCGRDRSAFTKPGELPEGMLSVTCKVTNNASDGLSRFRGIRTVGVVRRFAEDKLEVSRTFFMGLYLNPKRTIGESVEPDTFQAEGKFEDAAEVLAQ